MTTYQDHERASERGLVRVGGGRGGQRAGLTARRANLFAGRQLVCLRARVMRFGKYRLAFLPPNAKPGDHLFYAPPTSPPLFLCLLSLLVTLNDQLAN